VYLYLRVWWCVCVHVCMCACMCVYVVCGHACVCMHACMHVCVYACICVRVCVCQSAPIHQFYAIGNEWLATQIFARVYVCVCVCVCVSRRSHTQVSCPRQQLVGSSNPHRQEPLHPFHLQVVKRKGKMASRTPITQKNHDPPSLSPQSRQRTPPLSRRKCRLKLEK